MEEFVRQGSVVREIWGKADTVLLIFAGASAEFALNKAVDWLYYTGNLPSDPLGRLFSTVSYARNIVFASEATAHKTIRTITSIHQGVENQRKRKIPSWAYRDVLFMLIDYSIRSFEVLERKLTPAEKEEVFSVFFRVGSGMEITDLPNSYQKFVKSREMHLNRDLACSTYTTHLFEQYCKHLGKARYFILIEAQKLVVPLHVRKMLNYNSFSMLKPLLPPYKLIKFLKLDEQVKSLIIPFKFQDKVRDLNSITL